MKLKIFAGLRMRRMWRDSTQAVTRAAPRARRLRLALSIIMILSGTVTFIWPMVLRKNATSLPRPISLKVIAKNARLRAEPATDATVLARVGQGDVINVDAVTPQGWYRAQTAQGESWIFCGLVEGHTFLPFEPVTEGGRRMCKRKSDGLLISP